MTLKRILLFTIGLLYGAVVNSIAIGGCYGCWVVFLMLAGLQRIGLLDGMMYVGAEGGPILLAILGIPFAIGFIPGAIYGLVIGSWHCAMDFYNNGFKQGLTSPFRFLSALWKHKYHKNSNELILYYDSITSINVPVEQQKAKETILEHVQKISEAHPVEIPKDIAWLIADYAIAADEIKFSGDAVNQVGDRIQNYLLPLSSDRTPVVSAAEAGVAQDGDETEENNEVLATTAAETITAQIDAKRGHISAHLTQTQVSKLIQSFFYYKEDSITPSPHHPHPPTTPQPTGS